MQPRPFWEERIEASWRRRSVLWLMGVRRVGKTSLARALPDVEYLDCELPRVRRDLEDPEAFLTSVRRRRVILDEVHRLPNPSELLKIAADHHRDVKLLATGSSTLGASARFRDTLTGRKVEIWLTPMVHADLASFHRIDLPRRLLRGGLPGFFLADDLPEQDFQEWADAYWAKDVLELFRLERRASFQKFLELLLVQSGGMFEASKFAKPCEVSRPTIANYLAVLEETFVAHVIRPFSDRPSHEIVAAPKVYAFDTGFVCYQRGWNQLRRDDMGTLWEHVVLNEIMAARQSRDVRYWRTKHGNEMDFVLARRGRAPLAIECKWSRDNFDPHNLAIFRRHYPEGKNLCVTADSDRPLDRHIGDLTIRFIGLKEVAAEVGGA